MTSDPWGTTDEWFDAGQNTPKNQTDDWGNWQDSTWTGKSKAALGTPERPIPIDESLSGESQPVLNAAPDFKQRSREEEETLATREADLLQRAAKKREASTASSVASNMTGASKKERKGIMRFFSGSSVSLRMRL